LLGGDPRAQAGALVGEDIDDLTVAQDALRRLAVQRRGTTVSAITGPDATVAQDDVAPRTGFPDATGPGAAVMRLRFPPN
jgi:hypothetical protein